MQNSSPALKLRDITRNLFSSGVPATCDKYLVEKVQYLTLLACYLNANGLYHKECSALRWGEEHINLLPPFPHILADKTHLDGPEHQRTVAHILKRIKQLSLVSILNNYNLWSSHLL
jgi:hypothetical protein